MDICSAAYTCMGMLLQILPVKRRETGVLISQLCRGGRLSPMQRACIFLEPCCCALGNVPAQSHAAH